MSAGRRFYGYEAKDQVSLKYISTYLRSTAESIERFETICIIIWRKGNFAKYVSCPGLCLSLFLFAVNSLQFLTDQGDVWHIDQIWRFQATVLFWRKCWVWYENKPGYLWFWLSRDLFWRVLIARAPLWVRFRPNWKPHTIFVNTSYFSLTWIGTLKTLRYGISKTYSICSIYGISYYHIGIILLEYLAQ